MAAYDRIAPFVLIASMLLGASSAFPHALIVRSNPSANATVQTVPRDVSILFSERIQAARGSIVVEDANGLRVDDGDARVDPNGRVVRVTLKPRRPGPCNEIAVQSTDTHSQRSFSRVQKQLIVGWMVVFDASLAMSWRHRRALGCVAPAFALASVSQDRPITRSPRQMSHVPQRGAITAVHAGFRHGPGERRGRSPATTVECGAARARPPLQAPTREVPDSGVSGQARRTSPSPLGLFRPPWPRRRGSYRRRHPWTYPAYAFLPGSQQPGGRRRPALRRIVRLAARNKPAAAQPLLVSKRPPRALPDRLHRRNPGSRAASIQHRPRWRCLPRKTDDAQVYYPSWSRRRPAAAVAWRIERVWPVASLPIFLSLYFAILAAWVNRAIRTEGDNHGCRSGA